MALADHHFCWHLPVLLLVVMCTAWTTSYILTSSPTQTKLQQPYQQAKDGSNVTEVLTRLNHSSSSRSSSTVEEPPRCPPPYVRVMQQCYYANRNHQLPWRQARQFCQGMGGDLAQPVHVNALIAFVLDSYGDNVARWFIGGSDVKEEGDWRWLGGQPINSVDWPSGEPNGGTKENCLEFCFVCSGNRERTTFPAFNDENCNSTLNFICEYVATGWLYSS